MIRSIIDLYSKFFFYPSIDVRELSNEMCFFRDHLAELSDKEIGRVHSIFIIARIEFILNNIVPVGCFHDSWMPAPPLKLIYQTEKNLIYFLDFLRENDNDEDQIMAVLFWLYTLYAVNCRDLRSYGKLIWREIDRGRPYTSVYIEYEKHINPDDVDHLIKSAHDFVDFTPPPLK